PAPPPANGTVSGGGRRHSEPRTERAELCEASGVSGPAGGLGTSCGSAHVALRAWGGLGTSCWPAYSARLAKLGSLRARFGSRLRPRDTVVLDIDAGGGSRDLLCFARRPMEEHGRLQRDQHGSA